MLMDLLDRIIPYNREGPYVWTYYLAMPVLILGLVSIAGH